jgi:hypothetical protein
LTFYTDEAPAPAKEEKANKGKNKAESSTRATGAEDDDESDVSGKKAPPHPHHPLNVSLDSELDYLDTSLIIQSGRRTRGNKIDYTQFGADTPADEE